MWRRLLEQRTEPWERARWTVKPARVAGERVGTSESIGRRQNYSSTAVAVRKPSRRESSEIDGKPEG